MTSAKTKYKQKWLSKSNANWMVFAKEYELYTMDGIYVIVIGAVTLEGSQYYAKLKIYKKVEQQQHQQLGRGKQDQQQQQQ